MQNECIVCFNGSGEIGLGPVICPATSLVHEGYLVCTDCIQKWYRANSRCIVCNSTNYNSENRMVIGAGRRVAVILNGTSDLDPALFTREGFRLIREMDEVDGEDRQCRVCRGFIVLIAIFVVALWIVSDLFSK